MPRFVIYLKAHPGAWNKMSREDQSRLISEYSDWADQLKSEGRLESGEPVKQQIHHISPDRPFADYDHILDELVVTAFFRIVADSWDEAVAIAESCPARQHGEHVIVQPLADSD